MVKLHPLTRFAGVLGGLTVAVLCALSAPAAAKEGAFTASPSSGLAGSAITVTSVTPCTLPAGVTGAPVIRVSLTRGNTILGSASITVSASGSWSGTLTVHADASAGAAQLSAFCLASPQAEGAILAYTPLSFAVGSSELARTGTPWATTVMWGAVLLLAGITLIGATCRAKAGGGH
jgi:hypothetical protein